MRSINRLVATLLATLLLGACLTAGPGGCSPEEAGAFNEVTHYGDEPLVPEDHPSGICGATFTTGDDPDLVMEHYESVLREAGWTVNGPESGPITAEGGGQIGSTIDLTAAKDRMTFTVGAELLDGAESATFNVLAGDASG